MFILKIIYWILVGVLGLKIISNLLIPFTLFKKPILNEDTGETGGVSFMPLLEIVLLVLLLICSFFLGLDGSIYSLKETGLLFGGTIVVSYLFLFISLILAGWWKSKK